MNSSLINFKNLKGNILLKNPDNVNSIKNINLIQNRYFLDNY